MKRIGITALQEIRFEYGLVEPIQLSEEMTLCEYNPQLHSELGPQFELLIGKMEANGLATASSVIVFRNHSEDTEAGQDLLNEFLGKVQIFLHMLWLIKDNSANIELGFLKETPFKGPEAVHSNSRSNFMTMATGEVKEILFTENELMATVNRFRSAKSIEGKGKKATQLAKNVNRLAVFFYHLQAGRSIGDLGMKVAQYCTGLEALFSTSTSELAHQLSERTALFIGNDPDEKLEIYRTIKAAYSIRSKVSHGSTMKQNKIDELPIISVNIDNLLRRIYQKIHDEPELTKMFTSDSDLEDYFLKLLVGKI